jgi:hypothetical protein
VARTWSGPEPDAAADGEAAALAAAAVRGEEVTGGEGLVAVLAADDAG